MRSIAGNALLAMRHRSERCISIPEPGNLTLVSLPYVNLAGDVELTHDVVDNFGRHATRSVPRTCQVSLGAVPQHSVV